MISNFSEKCPSVASASVGQALYENFSNASQNINSDKRYFRLQYPPPGLHCPHSTSFSNGIKSTWRQFKGAQQQGLHRAGDEQV